MIGRSDPATMSHREKTVEPSHYPLVQRVRIEHPAEHGVSQVIQPADNPCALVPDRNRRLVRPKRQQSSRVHAQVGGKLICRPVMPVTKRQDRLAIVENGRPIKWIAGFYLSDILPYRDEPKAISV